MPRDQQLKPTSELAQHGLRYPNESQEYRKAREALLKDEQELVAKGKSVAEKRRKLPFGGELKEDYSFQWAGGGKVGQRVKFSELFGDKTTLLLYSWMFGPGWDKPCPSCTSLMDGFDRAWYSVAQDAPRLPRSPKRSLKKSTHGPGSAAGRRSRCCPDTSRRFRLTTSARARTTTGNFR
jgi:predicted dithiol-disulfide oxidoreductase (DUF899 family)